MPKPGAPAEKGSEKPAGKKQKKQAYDQLAPKGNTPEPAARDKRKLAIALSVSGGVLIVLAVAGYLIFGRSAPSNSNGSTTSPPPSVQQLVPRRIDSVLDDPKDQNRFPVAVMVENHTAARPQPGLDKANIVYEVLAEGGITRFMAVYTLTSAIAEIGPVRSARPYYVDWARGYNAMYAHIGGSPKALSRIASTGIFDFNQFFNSQYFWRDKSRDVASEHTLYTSSKLLALALIDKKAPTEGSYTPWKYKPEAASSERPSSQHLAINFSSFSYKVDYEYDPVNNDYVRSVAEKPHVMRDGTQLRAKNVVVLTVKRRLEEPVKDNHGRLEMDTVGEGAARFFLDGKEFKGTWKKTSPQDPIQLLLEDGLELQLNPGQTWVEVVPPEQEVTVR